MLLTLLRDFAVSRDLLKNPAFVKKPVRWIIQLDSNGRLIGLGPIETYGGEKKKAQEFWIPKTTRPTGGGQVSDFLVDDIGALFNLNPKPQTELNQRSINNLRAKHEDFWRQIREASLATGNPLLAALLRFYDDLRGDPPSFLRLDTSSAKWMIRKADGEEVKLGADLLTFEVEGNILINDEDVVRPYWQRAHAQEMAQSEGAAQRGVCLVTGQENVPIARTHTPMVTGLPSPARPTGAGLVGYDDDAFCSYGFKQSLNAPVSIQASKEYLAALQHLSKQDDHWMTVGPVWLCFWTAQTEEASSYFARLLKRPDSKTVKEFMSSPWKGLERLINKPEQFIAVTLSAAGPRIVVKNWLQIPLQEAVKNFQLWFRDLEIESYSKRETENERSPLSLDRLACTIIRRKSDGRFDRDKLAPDLVASLYRSALEGAPPPLPLLRQILERLKSNLITDGENALYDQSRFALLKLTLNRQLRMEGKPEMKPKVFETTDRAYNCGRLLAVFDSLQRSAHGKDFSGATIAERYFGSASTTPNMAFSLLWRLHQYHLKKLRQQGEKGQRAAARIKDTITQIAGLFEQKAPGEPPKFPNYFEPVEQGKFALGFYQQMAVRKAAIEEYMKKKQAGDLKPGEIDDELELTDNEQ